MDFSANPFAFTADRLKLAYTMHVDAGDYDSDSDLTCEDESGTFAVTVKLGGTDSLRICRMAFFRKRIQTSPSEIFTEK